MQSHLDSAHPSEDLYNYEARHQSAVQQTAKVTLGPSSHSPRGTHTLMDSIPRSNEDSHVDMGQQQMDRK